MQFHDLSFEDPLHNSGNRAVFPVGIVVGLYFSQVLDHSFETCEVGGSFHILEIEPLFPHPVKPKNGLPVTSKARLQALLPRPEFGLRFMLARMISLMLSGDKTPGVKVVAIV